MNTSEKIWNAYHQKLLAFIRSRVSGDIGDDLLQDVFIKMHTQIHTLKDSTKLESWLFQITRNTITDYYRNKRSTEVLPLWIAQPHPDTETHLRRELALCLKPMINALPEKYHNAIQMSEIENRTQNEIAEKEGISLSGAKSRVQRGRALLKEMLYDCCQFEVDTFNQVLSYERKGNDCQHC